jgi:DeoR/GlpR family transcriptional regulator of sugar metabolism
MLAAERHRQILDRLRRDTTVRTVDLARDFEVTEETIRRDLDLLAKRGRVTRTHGGAMEVGVFLGELSHQERANRQASQKSAIAREAAKLVKSGETLLLDASSTALELARQLPEDLGLRVVTYSLPVIEVLSSRTDVELIQLGGCYEPRGRRFSGMLTEAALRSLKIHRFFFSGGGFDAELGVSEPNPEQARLKNSIIGHAEWSCALIDSSKLGVRSDFFFAPLGSFAVLVTDSDSSVPIVSSSFELLTAALS